MKKSTAKPLGGQASYSLPLHLLLIVAIALAQYLRMPLLVGASQLFKEDVGVLFAHYYNSAEHFFIYYMGYVSVGTNLLGWLALRAHAPNRAIVRVGCNPVGGGRAFDSVPATLSYVDRFRSGEVVVLPVAVDSAHRQWAHRARHRVVLVADAARRGAAAGTADAEAFGTSLVRVGLPSCCDLFEPGVARAGSCMCLQRLACARCVSAHLIARPSAADCDLRGRDALRAWRCVLGQVGDGVVHPGAGSGVCGDTFLPVIGDRVVFEMLATNFVRTHFIWRGLLAFTAASGLAVLAGLIWAVRRVPVLTQLTKRNASLFAVLSYLSIAITAVSIAARFGPGALSYTDYFHHRYFWVQQYYLWVAIVAFALALMPRLPQRARQLIAMCAVLYPLVGGYLDRAELSPGLEDRETTAEFLKELHACEQQDCGNPVVFHGHDERFDISIRDFR